MKNNKNKNYEYLKDKWVKRHQDVTSKIAEKHSSAYKWLNENSKQLAVGALGSIMLATTPMQAAPATQSAPNLPQQEFKIGTKAFMISDLGHALPDEMRPLTTDEEAKVGEILSKDYGMNVTAEMNGLRLNRSYGLIGAEQHLARYPGDTMATHFDGNAEDAAKYYSSGMAPGLGAWGYFATSRAAMTEEDDQREKYYIAVQTFLSPDFNNKVAEYRDFYKFRKMLVVNPQNGKAVVAVIGDAGPAEWTGKHLGGSPEVMKHLERVDGKARGPVLYYFIEDPNDDIPLGPIEPK
ncbi:MAG: hypothetical protein E6Q89_00505 [Bacteroidia bacterium]|nr:MAG: hypothetical protein E6Q89_00505 [Bacteroidia bacterium]